MSRSTLRVADVSTLLVGVARGTRSCTSLPIATLASGLDLQIPVHIVAGSRVGPTVALTGATHGDNVAGPQWIRAVLEGLDPAELAGSVIGVPVGNPAAFEWDRRHTPNDGANMNRSYPGDPDGSLTERMAYALGGLIRQVDLLIDCHGGSETSINYMYGRPTGDASYDDRVFELARIFGMEYLWQGTGYAGSLTHLAYKDGTPALILELGNTELCGAKYLAEAVRGTRNVLQHLRMLSGTPKLRGTQWLLHERKLIRPRNGGLFVPEIGPEGLNAVVTGGSILGRVWDPTRLEEIEAITAPFAETAVLQTRPALTRVHPGDYAYILGNRGNAQRFDN